MAWEKIGIPLEELVEVAGHSIHSIYNVGKIIDGWMNSPTELHPFSLDF